MAEPFIGQICMFGFNFAPRGWALCNGQQMAIAQQSTLYALIGSFYGGDDRTYFNLPDFRGRFPLSFGQGPGLPNYVIGQKSGWPSVQLQAGQMPAHTHPAAANTSIVQTAETSATLKGATDGGNATSPEGANLASGTNIYRSSPRSLKDMAETSIAVTQPQYSANTTVTVEPNQGGTTPVQIMNPYLAVNFCIALMGMFPSRN